MNQPNLLLTHWTNTASADDVALVEDAIGDLERFEREISDVPTIRERAVTS